MFISGHFHLLGMRNAWKFISCVAVGKPERQVHKVSHCGRNQK